ncbi:hypothetical protein L9G16_03220 [Shewanella sp. A25]|nr:hypothetical protein [Shewanella shenzhenensis]
MEKSTQWNQEDSISPISWAAMLICIILFIYEHFWGHDFTTMVVMLYCTFMLPSVLLIRKVQEKYFLYTLEYIRAFRKFTTVMSVIFLCIWVIATLMRFLK